MQNELLKGIMTVVLGLTLLTALTGCKKKAEPVKPQGNTNSVSATVEQTICPVMGGLVDKNVFAEYRGKKVYFCCPECKGQFEKNPEKYISKLPQFAK